MVLADSRQLSRIRRYSGSSIRDCTGFAYATITLFGLPFQAVPLTNHGPTADPQPRCHFRDTGLGLFFPVRSPLLRESLNCFLFLRVLRCFSSPGLPPFGFHASSMEGCPIRISADHNIFAPPRSLTQLNTSFFASESQGIHRTPLS